MIAPQFINKRQGSAILMVFWSVAVMSVCVLGLVQYVHSDQDEVISQKKDARAYDLAESGMAIGLNPQVGRADPVLKQVVAPGEIVEVHLRSEGARLNINTVLQNKEWDILENLFREWGMDEVDTGNLVNAFESWAYPARTSSSATSPPSVNQPVIPARQFQAVNDMQQVFGMNKLNEVKPDWSEYFTVWSGGLLDMNEAPVDLIVAVCAVGKGRAEDFVNMRLGLDGKPGTADDLVFKNMEQVRQLLAMPQDEFALIQNRLSLQDAATRIESTGTLGTYRRKITAVVRRDSTPGVYFLWQES